MIKEIKRQIVLNRSNALIGLIVAVALGLAFSLIIAIIAKSNTTPSAYPPLGGILFSSAAAFFTLIMALGGTSSQFNMSLKMGAVRRLYLPALALLCFVFCLVMMLLGNLWGLLDRAVLQAMGAQTIPFSFGAPLAAFIALAATVFGCWAGGFIMRYGRKGFWLMWAIWMVFTLGGSQAAAALSSSRTDLFARGVKAVAGFLGGLPLSGLWVLGLAAVVAMAAHTWGMLHRVQASD